MASQFKAKIRQFKIKDYLRMEYFIHPMINDFAFKLSFSYGKKKGKRKTKVRKFALIFNLKSPNCMHYFLSTASALGNLQNSSWVTVLVSLLPGWIRNVL